jgi:HAD superfamily hydrolase (TIGR01509 family)
MPLKALIFDVDGTLAETEETHRAAFNAAFAQDGLDWFWDVDLYRELLRVTGGKERLRRYAQVSGLAPSQLPEARIARLHALKNEFYAGMVGAGACPLRPGVEPLIRHAADAGLALAIATTTSRVNVEALVTAALGVDGLGAFDIIVAGEDVRAKKPAPDAYLLAIQALALNDEDCIAFEDSRNGLQAALAANLRTVVTPSLYTAHESLEGAVQVLTDLSAFDLEELARAR